MDQVQEWLSAGSNGRGKKGRSSREGEAAQEADNVLKGLVDRLSKSKEESGGHEAGRERSYLDQEMDVPGLDVPERDE